MIAIQTKQLIADILEQPNAPGIVKEVSDHLTDERKRREQFYKDITDEEKAEFINGDVIIHSPVVKEHSDVTRNLSRLLSSYVDKYRLGYIGIEKLMISLTRNDYEPDICFFKTEKSRNFKKGQSLFPAPDLIVEILSKRKNKNDRGIKFQDYQTHQVFEYWLIDPVDEIVEQYRLDSHGEYELILKNTKGDIESKVVDGFKINITSIFKDENNLEELSWVLGDD